MPAIDYQIFRRQFYIGLSPKKVDDTWQSKTLFNGLILSFSSSLPVSIIQDRNQTNYVLLGTVVQSLDGAPAPVDGIKALTDKRQVQDVYKSWSGRWVLIVNDELHLDATGLLGCFYRNDVDGIEVSSAAGLIAGDKLKNTFKLEKQVGADYYPLPDSGFKGIHKLLPSQVLNLSTGAIQFRNLKYNLPQLSYEESIAYLGNLIKNSLKNYAALDRTKSLQLALTGGNDSRVLLAGLQASKSAYEIFTFDGPNINPKDVAIPRLLSKLVGKKHNLVKRKKRKQENLEKFNLHTSYHSVENDREFMLYQQFDFFEGGKTVLLRGNCFEIGRCYYYKWLPQELANGSVISASQKGNEQQGESWNKWVEWVKQTPEVAMDWRDRFYIEQRTAGWLSSIEQALDLVNIDRFTPANSFLFYNVMLNIPEQTRISKVHMKDLVHYLDPQMLQVPINPPVGYYYKQYRRVLFKLGKIKQKLNLT